MEIKIIQEAGLEQALIGMKLSFQPECPIDDIPNIVDSNLSMSMRGFNTYTDRFDKYMETAKKLCKRDGGHNKFIEHIQVWMRVRAPLDWWKQMDTYRVGTSKLSKSTMHTIMRKPITKDDFNCEVDQRILDVVEEYRLAGNFNAVSKNLPQGFLQSRSVNTNYRVIRNIILQRNGHKLPEWKEFIVQMFLQLQHKELLGIDFMNDKLLIDFKH